MSSMKFLSCLLLSFSGVLLQTTGAQTAANFVCEQFTLNPSVGPRPENPLIIPEGGSQTITCNHDVISQNGIVWNRESSAIREDIPEGPEGCSCRSAPPDETPGTRELTFTDFARESAGVYSCRVPVPFMPGVFNICQFDVVWAESDCSNPSLNDCHVNATCTDIPGSHVCECVDGYAGNGTFCRNIDECQNEALNNCNDKADCFDTDGSFHCTCREGYFGTGIDCQGMTTDQRDTSTIILIATIVPTLLAVVILTMLVTIYICKKIPKKQNQFQKEDHYSIVGPPALPERNTPRKLGTHPTKFTEENQEINPAYAMNIMAISDRGIRISACDLRNECHDTMLLPSNAAYGTDVSIAPEIGCEENLAYEQKDSNAECRDTVLLSSNAAYGTDVSIAPEVDCEENLAYEQEY